MVGMVFEFVISVVILIKILCLITDSQLLTVPCALELLESAALRFSFMLRYMLSLARSNKCHMRLAPVEASVCMRDVRFLFWPPQASDTSLHEARVDLEKLVVVFGIITVASEFWHLPNITRFFDAVKRRWPQHC